MLTPPLRLPSALSAALRRVTEDVTDVSEDRVAQELALLAVKQDVTEEIDRLAALHLELGDEDRRKLVITLAKHLAGHLHDNSVDIFGPGDYVGPFIDKLNRRGAEYAEFNYTGDGPSYPFMRHLGYEIQQIMGESQENRWVIDQVMDRDGPDIDREIRRAIDNLFE